MDVCAGGEAEIWSQAYGLNHTSPFITRALPGTASKTGRCQIPCSLFPPRHGFRNPAGDQKSTSTSNRCDWGNILLSLHSCGLFKVIMMKMAPVAGRSSGNLPQQHWSYDV